MRKAPDGGNRAAADVRGGASVEADNETLGPCSIRIQSWEQESLRNQDGGRHVAAAKRRSRVALFIGISGCFVLSAWNTMIRTKTFLPGLLLKSSHQAKSWQRRASSEFREPCPAPISGRQISARRWSLAET